MCTQGQAHSPGIRVHLRVQASPAGVRLSPTHLGKGHSGPRLPFAREELSRLHTELSKSGDSFLSQLFDEGHLIPIPDTVTEREGKTESSLHKGPAVTPPRLCGMREARQEEHSAGEVRRGQGHAPPPCTLITLSPGSAASTATPPLPPVLWAGRPPGSSFKDSLSPVRDSPGLTHSSGWI